MKTYDLTNNNAQLLNLVDYEVDLLSSPPEIKETVKKTEEFTIIPNEEFSPENKNTTWEEGRLNVFVCDFSNEKYCIYIYGRINGQNIYSKKEFKWSSNVSTSFKNTRIKYILIHSRNILKNYYLSSDAKSIEKHLTTFLAPL